MRKLEYIGKRFGIFTVLSETKIRRNGESLFYLTCLCDCGKTFNAWPTQVSKNNKHQKDSCGCLGRARISKCATKHGKVGTRIYNTWVSMKQRCLNPNFRLYNRYGGRGLTICKRWMDFNTFFKDMGDVPEGKSIGRINNDKGYYKKNCRWETDKEQALNTTMVKLITFNGITDSYKGWGERTGIDRSTIRRRIKRGFPLEKVFAKGTTLKVKK